MLNALKMLYLRDFDALIANIEACPEEHLWTAPAGVTNTVGILTQHLVGNLNHFIGMGFGGSDYVRRRKLEFTNTGISKDELSATLHPTRKMLETVLSSLSEKDLDKDYPIDVPFGLTPTEFLLHLYHHLSYHLGQINYLRRMLAA